MVLPTPVARLIWGRSQRSSDFPFRGDVPDPASMSGELERLFWANEGPAVHKWLHYFPIYERYFSGFRGTPLRFLEIGVSKGGSLDMWRSYFGPEAVIYGIDIDEACAQFDGRSAQVRIGSQDDPAFLASVVAEMGGVDVVLDDGSHDSRHIRASLDVLFPLLSEGGVYMMEDLHAAYWVSHSGGYRRPSSIMETVKTMIDDLHHWYHGRGQSVAATTDNLAAIHVHDSITVLEKGRQDRPSNAVRGHG
jgi:hypothetical protein